MLYVSKQVRNRALCFLFYILRGDYVLFALKFIKFVSKELPLTDCKAGNMEFFKIKLAAVLLRGHVYV